MKLTQNQQKIMTALINLPGKKIIKLRDLKLITGISTRNIHRNITKLIEGEYIISKEVIRTKSINGTKYVLNDELCKQIVDNKKKPPKNYKLREAYYRLSSNEQRLVTDMIFMIRKNQKLGVYKYKIKYLAKLIDVDYKQLKGITSRLLSKVLNIYDKNKIIQANWLSSATYQGEYIELCFDQQLKPYLSELKDSFTSFQLINTINLKNKYSIRIYELLKFYERVGEHTFTVEEFSSEIGMDHNVYSAYNELKRIIVRSRREIIKKTDISFQIKEKKKGRKVISITFFIKSNEKTKTDEQDKKSKDKKILVRKRGIKKTKAEEAQILKKRFEKNLRRKVNAVFKELPETERNDLLNEFEKIATSDPVLLKEWKKYGLKGDNVRRSCRYFIAEKFLKKEDYDFETWKNTEHDNNEIEPIPEWKPVQEKLKRKLSESEYENWIEDIKAEKNDGKITLTFNNEYSKDWVLDQYRELIESVIGEFQVEILEFYI